VIAACSTAGPRPDYDAVEAFQPGVTTAEGALAKLGAFSSERTLPGGKRLLQWGVARKGGSEGGHQRIALLFDQSGRMLGAIWESADR
jgi:hypothetical protein